MSGASDMLVLSMAWLAEWLPCGAVTSMLLPAVWGGHRREGVGCRVGWGAAVLWPPKAPPGLTCDLHIRLASDRQQHGRPRTAPSGRGGGAYAWHGMGA